MYLVYKMLFGLKKQALLILMVLLVIMSFVLAIDFGQSMAERLYDQEAEMLLFQTLGMQSMFMMFPLIGLMTAFDHDQPYLVPLMTYKGRLRIMCYQSFIYVNVIVLSGLVVLGGYDVITHIFFKLKTPLTLLFDIYIALVLDTFYLMIIFMVISTHHQKIKAFILFMSYIIGFMILGDHHHMILYYFLPLGYHMFAVTSYAYLYKFLYALFLGVIFFYHKSTIKISSF